MKTRTKRDRRTLSSSLSGEVLQWLLTRGHSQVEVAQMLGVSESFISLVKSRERSFTLDHMQTLADTLNLPLGAMLLQITDRHSKNPQFRAFLERTEKLIRKCDEVRELIKNKASAERR